jgi:hypothetical protein
MGYYNAFGIATRYKLDGPGIKPRWEARFSTPALETTQFSVK